MNPCIDEPSRAAVVHLICNKMGGCLQKREESVDILMCQNMQKWAVKYHPSGDYIQLVLINAEASIINAPRYAAITSQKEALVSLLVLIGILTGLFIWGKRLCT